MPKKSVKIFSYIIFMIVITDLVPAGELFLIPDRISVRPVFFIPQGEAVPDREMTAALQKHLEWSRETYSNLLDDRDTFCLSKEPVLLYRAKHNLEYYRNLPEDGAPMYAAEILDQQGSNRLVCPYVFVIIVMNRADNFPVGGGRPLNGSINTGGGIVIASSFSLLNSPNFQSTLRHELGHSFGLPHVDTYGYNMNTNHSIMSYNKAHHTSGFIDTRIKGCFIPEDLRALSFNKKVFSKLEFDPEKDIPNGYNICPEIIRLGPMSIPEHFPYEIKVNTGDGEKYDSSVLNTVMNVIKPDTGPGITFDPKTMWHSDKNENGPVSIDIEFPLEVAINRISVHSQHSGKYHKAESVTVEIPHGETFREISSKPLSSADHEVRFPLTRSARWRFQFESGESSMVVIRGLRFFYNNPEILPSLTR